MIRPLSDGAGSIGQWLQTESSLMTHFTPFFTFALELVVPGTLVVLLLALLLTGE